MSLYRKKPVVIEARRTGEGYDEDCAIVGWVGDDGFLSDSVEGDVDGALFYIHTLEGSMAVMPGDWVIKGVAGEFYPHKPDIFALAYERVEEP